MKVFDGLATFKQVQHYRDIWSFGTISLYCQVNNFSLPLVQWAGPKLYNNYR